METFMQKLVDEVDKKIESEHSDSYIGGEIPPKIKQRLVDQEYNRIVIKLVY